MYKFRNFYVPERMMESIKAYVEERRPVGDFLEAVICNDLKNAVAYADDENLLNLPAFVAYFYLEAPSLCWGSKEHMINWLNKKDLEEKSESST